MKDIAAAQKVKPVRERKVPVKEGTRLVLWSNFRDYEILRKSDKVFASITEIIYSFHEQTLKEEDTFLLRHLDHNVINRGCERPVYEVVYKMRNGRFYVVQKRHLAQMYAKAGRVDDAQKLSVDSCGHPYWVDRYIFSRQKKKFKK